MTNPARDWLLGELLAERFGSVQSPTPPVQGSTVELLRRAELVEGDDLAEVIDLPVRNRTDRVTSTHPDALTHRPAASQ